MKLLFKLRNKLNWLFNLFFNTQFRKDQKIKYHLNQKLNSLCKKLPDDFADILRKKGYFPGGCIRDLIQGIKPKDYDLFVIDKSATELLRDNLYHLFYTTANSINIGNGSKFQIILVDSGLEKDVVGRFDFTFNQNYYRPETDNLVIYDREAILNKRIKFNENCRNIYDSTVRSYKFLERGYVWDSEKELAKAAYKCVNIGRNEKIDDPLPYEIVDIAYFHYIDRRGGTGGY